MTASERIETETRLEFLMGEIEAIRMGIDAQRPRFEELRETIASLPHPSTPNVAELGRIRDSIDKSLADMATLVTQAKELEERIEKDNRRIQSED